jgi:hypothetical protein
MEIDMNWPGLVSITKNLFTKLAESGAGNARM